MIGESSNIPTFVAFAPDAVIVPPLHCIQRTVVNYSRRVHHKDPKTFGKKRQYDWDDDVPPLIALVIPMTPYVLDCGFACTCEQTEPWAKPATPPLHSALVFVPPDRGDDWDAATPSLLSSLPGPFSDFRTNFFQTQPMRCALHNGFDFLC